MCVGRPSMSLGDRKILIATGATGASRVAVKLDDHTKEQTVEWRVSDDAAIAVAGVIQPFRERWRIPHSPFSFLDAFPEAYSCACPDFDGSLLFCPTVVHVHSRRALSMGVFPIPVAQEQQDLSYTACWTLYRNDIPSISRAYHLELVFNYIRLYSLSIGDYT